MTARTHSTIASTLIPKLLSTLQPDCLQHQHTTITIKHSLVNVLLPVLTTPSVSLPTFGWKMTAHVHSPLTPKLTL